MAKRTEELEEESCLYALYDTKTKTFLRKESWLGFAGGHIKIYADVRKANSELKMLGGSDLGNRTKIVRLDIGEYIEMLNVKKNK